MRREILFRGKTSAGEWVEGYYLNRSNEKEDIHCIMEKYPATVGKRVIPETVGQFTGLYDKNGKKIFEGDIIKYPYHKSYNVIAFENGAFGYTTKRFECFRSFDDGEDGIAADLAEVIGNIHDNPELLK